jgi:hypothetical protein
MGVHIDHHGFFPPRATRQLNPTAVRRKGGQPLSRRAIAFGRLTPLGFFMGLAFPFGLDPIGANGRDVPQWTFQAPGLAALTATRGAAVLIRPR